MNSLLAVTPKPITTKDNSVVLEMLNECLDGFIMILASDGNVLFVTDQITEFLGIQKVKFIRRRSSSFFITFED